MAALVGGTFDALMAAPLNEETSSLLLYYAHTWASTHLDVRLRAVEFFAGV
jgi:DNA repair protein RecO (recombination protein O)